MSAIEVREVRDPFRHWTGAVGSVALAAAALTFLSGCSDAGDVGLINDSDEVVTVEYGGDGPEEIPAGGGVVILEAGECFDGPIVVTYESGQTVDVPGQICPGEDLRITAANAEVMTHAS